MYVYDWKAGIRLARFYNGLAKVLDIAFIPSISSNQSPACLVVVGNHYIKFWYDYLARFACPIHADYQDIGNLSVYTCVVDFQGQALVGNSDGSLYIFTGHKLKQLTQAHLGPVYALHTVASRGQMMCLSGGIDGMVRVWNAAMECIHEYSIAAVSKCHSNFIRAAVLSSDGLHLLIGLQGAEIIELDIHTGKVNDACLVKGHGNRCYALATHPRSAIYATAGDDGVLR